MIDKALAGWGERCNLGPCIIERGSMSTMTKNIYTGEAFLLLSMAKYYFRFLPFT